MSYKLKYLGLILCIILAVSGNAHTATTMDKYYAHEAVTDSFGVIAPWYNGQNGFLDFRVRVSAEFLKRYPWVDANVSVMSGPHYIFNPMVDIAENGEISVLYPNNRMNGNLGQRFKYMSEGFPRYYRYTGDPFVLSHLRIIADYILEYNCTDGSNSWPKFPISVPLKGIPYGKAAQDGYIQLDLSAGIGRVMIIAYKLTADERYLNAAKHWGEYMMNHKDIFPNWKNDVRNIISMFLRRTGASPKSNTDVFSGAWAYPESNSCCLRAMDFPPVFLGTYLARYAVETLM